MAGTSDVGVITGSNNGQILNSYATTDTLIEGGAEKEDCKLSGNQAESDSNKLIGECNEGDIFGAQNR